MRIELAFYFYTIVAAANPLFSRNLHQSQHEAASKATSAIQSPEVYAKRTYFYAGGQYVNTTQEESNTTTAYMVGQIYVEKLEPQEIKYKIPLLFICGAGQTATNWLNTPDGREGWASFFLRQGYTIYLTDQSQRGRSAWLPGEGIIVQSPVVEVEAQFTAPQDFPSYPQAKTHTQWPGTGLAGDPTFDAFMGSQVQEQVNYTMQALYNNASYVALVQEIGPAIVIAHSQAGAFGWQLGDAAPGLVKAIVALEPAGPPFLNWAGPPFAPGYISQSAGGERPFGVTLLPLHYDPPIGTNYSLLKHQNHSAAGPDLAPCLRQQEPARKLVNLARIPVLFLTSESSYHAVYDYCTVAYLKQAGVDVEWIHLPKVGIKGNGHFIFMEKNNIEIAELVAPWLRGHAD